jgi:hypothetical protein
MIANRVEHLSLHFWTPPGDLIPLHSLEVIETRTYKIQPFENLQY